MNAPFEHLKNFKGKMVEFQTGSSKMTIHKNGGINNFSTRHGKLNRKKDGIGIMNPLSEVRRILSKNV